MDVCKASYKNTNWKDGNVGSKNNFLSYNCMERSQDGKKRRCILYTPLEIGKEEIVEPQGKTEVLATSIALSHNITTGLSNGSTEKQVKETIRILPENDEEIPVNKISPGKIKKIEDLDHIKHPVEIKYK